MPWSAAQQTQLPRNVAGARERRASVLLSAGRPASSVSKRFRLAHGVAGRWAAISSAIPVASHTLNGPGVSERGNCGPLETIRHTAGLASPELWPSGGSVDRGGGRHVASRFGDGFILIDRSCLDFPCCRCGSPATRDHDCSPATCGPPEPRSVQSSDIEPPALPSPTS